MTKLKKIDKNDTILGILSLLTMQLQSGNKIGIDNAKVSFNG